MGEKNTVDLSFNNTKTNSSSTVYNHTNDDNLIYHIFSKSNVLFLIWFLAIYLIVFFILGIFYRDDGLTNKRIMASRILDLMVFITVFVYLIYNYWYLSEYEAENMVKSNVNSILHYINDSYSLFSTLLFIFIFYIFIFLFGIPMSYDEKPISVNIIETISWIFLLIIIIVYFCKHILKIPILDIFNDWTGDVYGSLSTAPLAQPVSIKKDSSGNKIVDSSNNTPEVFNISNNSYTYDDAKAICKAYGSRLATYDDIEKSYNDGGEWCNYGWSDNQMIFFPTQQKTWDTLQKNPKTKNNCGRPGINGGYMENPYLKFGVNCYGKKPPPKSSDLAALEEKKNQITPKTAEDILLENKVNFWKEHADKLLNLNSFNGNKWSEVA